MTLQDASHIAIIASAFGVLGILGQVFFASKNIKDSHEKSRRKKAVELLKDWSLTVQKEQTWARKLVELLNTDQCRSLANQEPFEVPEKLENHLSQFFEIKDDQKENGFIKLSEKQVVTLRWYVVSYLNLLESILVAWQYTIVDREIIEHQFSYLFSPEKGHSALSAFRVASGGEKAYPATEIFSNHLEAKRREILKQKSKIA